PRVARRLKTGFEHRPALEYRARQHQRSARERGSTAASAAANERRASDRERLCEHRVARRFATAIWLAYVAEPMLHQPARDALEDGAGHGQPTRRSGAPWRRYEHRCGTCA